MGNMQGICGEHMEVTYTMIVQGESYYETLVMCNYAVAGNLQGEKYICQSSPDLVIRRRDVRSGRALLGLPPGVLLSGGTLCHVRDHRETLLALSVEFIEKQIKF